CFFFQAEDGIRDFHVTGVQTCALPIFCSTSTTEATSSIGVYSCTSVSTGTPTWRFTSPRIRRPSSMPGPRKLPSEVRLALSKLDLKMKGMPSAEVISFSCPATSTCSCSLSTTQGPEIRNSGQSSPTSKPHRFMGKPFFATDLHGWTRIKQKRKE